MQQGGGRRSEGGGVTALRVTVFDCKALKVWDDSVDILMKRSATRGAAGENAMSRMRCFHWAGVLLMVGLIGCHRDSARNSSPTEGEVPASTSAEEFAKETSALQGRWEVVSAEFEGKPASAAYRPGTAFVTVIVINGDELYFTDSFTQSKRGKFRIDAKVQPNSIDIGEDKEAKKAVRGIYSLDGDSLKLCVTGSGNRPKEFKTAPGDKTNLFVLKRQKS
jgi:uncharacterized protein (TIGR03067 family)